MPSLSPFFLSPFSSSSSSFFLLTSSSSSFLHFLASLGYLGVPFGMLCSSAYFLLLADFLCAWVKIVFPCAACGKLAAASEFEDTDRFRLPSLRTPLHS